MNNRDQENAKDESKSSDDEEVEVEEDDPLKCRMYANTYPKAGDLVVVEVRTIEEMGAYCALLEYNNLEGMLLMTELQRKRIRSVKRVIKEGRQEIVEVLRVNRQKNFIDLSKKRVDVEMMPKVEDRWNKSRAAHSIMTQACILSNKAYIEAHQTKSKNKTQKGKPAVSGGDSSKDNSLIADIVHGHSNIKFKYTLKQFYKLFGWQMAKDFGHLYDAFKFAMSNWEDVLERYPAIPDDVRPFLLKNIDKRLKPQMVTVRSKIEITCFTREGVAAIKRALKAGLSLSTDKMPIKIKLVAPPSFTVSVSTLEPDYGVQIIQNVVQTIRESILQAKGTFNVTQAAQVIADME